MSPVLLISMAAAAAPPAPTHDQIAQVNWGPPTFHEHQLLGNVPVAQATIDGVACFRGQARVQPSPDQLLAVVTDIASTKTWSSAGIVDGRVLWSSEAGDRLHYFQVLDVPDWTLAANRYWFLSGKVERLSDGVRMRWTRLENSAAYPELAQIRVQRPRAVEPPVNVGSWTFRIVPDGTEVDYVICTDFGGSMPDLLKNAASRTALPGTIGDVVAEALRR